MKKMKRFLSLLICMVMLMSFLPMGASAAESVTINYSRPAAGAYVYYDFWNIQIQSPSGAAIVPYSIDISPDQDYDDTYQAGQTYTITFVVQAANNDEFEENLAVSVTDENVSASRIGKVYEETVNMARPGSYYPNYVTVSRAKIELSFTIPRPAYTITFDGNDGTPTAETGTTGTDGKLTTLLPTANRTGYAFDGWYTKKIGGDKVDQNTVFTQNTTVYAHWKALPTITFNANGGTVDPASDETDTNGKLASLPVPTHTEEIFVGWFTAAEGGDEVDEDTVFTQNTEIFAHWRVRNTYTVSYNANAGDDDVSVPKAQIKTEDISLNLDSAKPERTGYDFTGWKAEDDTVYQPGDPYTANVGTTMTAQWAIKTYTVTYDNNSGTGEFDVQIKEHGKDLQLRAGKPTRNGYNFTGWKAEDNTVYQPEDSYAANEGTTLKAQWEAIEYDIVYHPGVGTLPENAPVKYTIEGGVTLPVLTKDCYHFDGWYLDDGFTGEPVADIAENNTGEKHFYAKWTPVVKSIEVSPNPKTLYTGDKETFTAKVVAGEGIDTSKIVWSVEPDPAEEPIALLSDEETTIDEKTGVLSARKPGKYIVKAIVEGHNIVGTAKVEVLPVHTVTFNANGKGTAPDPQPVGHGLTATEPDAPEADGYSFAGWYLDKECTKAYEFASPVVEDTTLYAKWLEVYTITYKLDGGAATNPTTYTVESDAIPLTNPTKAGYTFAGWTGTDLDAATMEVTIAKGSTGDREYTATWTQNVVPVTYFKVTYDANKGTGEMPVVSVEAGKDHTLLANEFKAPSGKVFKCWKVGNKEFKAGEKITVDSDVTVKAVWKNKTASSDLDYVPAAGDNFPTFLWAGLLLFSVVALVEVVVLRRKRS